MFGSKWLSKVVPHPLFLTISTPATIHSGFSKLVAGAIHFLCSWVWHRSVLWTLPLTPVWIGSLDNFLWPWLRIWLQYHDAYPVDVLSGMIPQSPLRTSDCAPVPLCRGFMPTRPHKHSFHQSTLPLGIDYIQFHMLHYFSYNSHLLPFHCCMQ